MARPLRQLIPDILQHITSNDENLRFNFRLYKVLEGQIKKEVEDSLSLELISRAAFSRAIQRIPPINLLKRTTDKLSKVYVEPPLRLSDNSTDEEIMHVISKEAHMDKVMSKSNELFNALHSYALEPYIDGDKHKVRVLAPHQFIPFSDDPRDPTKMTVFIKMMGSRTEIVNGTASAEGDRQDTEKSPSLINIYALYSDKEFLIIDSTGAVRGDIAGEMGITHGRNPFGRIPFIYDKKSMLELIPYPNQVGLDMSILIPKLLTDLNYAVQFLSHSIIYAKNTNLENMELNPDAIINLGDSDSEGNDPEIGTINPEIAIEEQLSLVEFQVQSYFDSIGIKTSASGSVSNGRDASGISKAIDEGDITAEKKVQTEHFKKVETELWSLMSDMQKVWSARSIKEKRTFTDDFKDSMRVMFSEVKPLKSNKQKLEEIEIMRDQKLITRKQSLRVLFPDYTEPQIDAWVKELEDEAETDMEMMLSMGINNQADTSPDGTFKDDNQVGAKQTPESKPNEDKN